MQTTKTRPLLSFALGVLVSCSAEDGDGSKSPTPTDFGALAPTEALPGQATGAGPIEPMVPSEAVQTGQAGQATPSAQAGSLAPGVDRESATGTPNSGSDAAVAAGPADDGTDTMDALGPLNMAPAKFGPNVQVAMDRTGAMQTEVVMEARGDGLILVGFMDQREGMGRCGFTVSQDGGATWSDTLFAATQGGFRAFAGDPAVAIDDAGTLYAGCQDYASGGLGTNYVLLAHSVDDGATWSDFTRVNQSLDKPWLGASGDGVVLLSWLGSPGGVKRSDDYGATWSEPVSLGYINHGTTLSFGENGLVHMAYNTSEDTVTYRRSKDGGKTFEPARDLANQGRACRAPCSPRSHPIIGADCDPTGQVVAITWASRQDHPDAEDDDDVWVIVSYDGGDTFSDPQRVNDNSSPSRQFQSWVAVDTFGAVHVVWTDLRNNGQNSTYYARMLDPEVGFEENVEVTDGTGDPSSFLGDYKGIDIEGRDVVVTWTDTRNDIGDIYFARAREAAAAGGPLALQQPSASR